MTTTNTTNGITLKLNIMYQRVFYFGATGQTVTVNISKAGGAFGAAQNSPASEISAGFYTILLTATDTNTAGDLAYNCTASAGGPAVWTDQVVTQLFSDLSINGSGQALISSNVKQNTSLNGFMFIMTVNSVPRTGLAVTAQRSLAGAGFSNCANAVTEVAAGWYTINLASTDLNAATVALRFTSPGADDKDILIITQP